MLHTDPSVQGVSGIYRIYLRDGEPGHEYVGQSADIARRWRDHHKLLLAGENTIILQRSWDKHGESAFEWAVLEEVPPDSKLLTAREQYYLDTRKPLYNIAKVAGTTLGVRYDERVREIYRQGAHKRHERYRRGEIQLTERQKQQMAAAFKSGIEARRAKGWSASRRQKHEQSKLLPPSPRLLARYEGQRGRFDRWKIEKSMQVMAERREKQDAEFFARMQGHGYPQHLTIGRYQAACQIGSECGYTTRVAWLALGRLEAKGLVSFTPVKGREQPRTEARLAYWERKRGTTQSEEHKAKVNAKRAIHNAEIAEKARASILQALQDLGWGNTIHGLITPASAKISALISLHKDTIRRYLGLMIEEGVIIHATKIPSLHPTPTPSIPPPSLTQLPLFQEDAS